MTRSSATHRTPVSYIDKSREFYAAQGYEQPYRWASNDDSPFAPLTKPLTECTVGIVTTSFPTADPLPKRVRAEPTAPAPTEMFTADLSWDKDATHTDDPDTFLPISQLEACATDGTIGAVGPSYYCVTTEYSQRRTASDAATIAQWAHHDALDLVLLVPL